MHIVTALATTTGTAPTVLLLALSVLPVLVVYVWTSIGLARVYTKIGVAGWKAWVPIYNAAVFLRLGGLSGWLLLLLLIPVFGAVFVYVALITAAYRISVAFGYGAGMTVLAALLFPVWASVVGFGDAEPDAAPGVDEDEVAPAVEALRTLDPGFGRVEPAAAGDDLLGGSRRSRRRDELPPSAWIPPGSGEDPFRPVAPEPAPAPEAWPAPLGVVPEPAPAPAAAPAPAPAAAPVVEPVEPNPVAAPGPEPVRERPVAEEPVTRSAVAEPEPAHTPAEPAPVTSWWMPAPETEAPAAPVTRRPLPQDDPDEPEPPAWLTDDAPAVPEAHGARAVLRQPFIPESDAFPEDSGAVSAVAGAPTAGAPRSAAASVSAFRPGLSDDVDDTVIALRKRPTWALELPDGTSVDLTADAVVLGRRPAPVHAAPGAQLVTVEEETRTVSKTHALLRRRGDVWTVTDLDSTNGVVVEDVELPQGGSAPVDGDFLLGDAVLRLVHRTR